MSKIQRSYARIMWRKNDILGLQMINSKGHQFFIYAEPLLTLVENKDEYVRIKRRDNSPSIHSDHHPGEIYGIFEEFRDRDIIPGRSEGITKTHMYYKLTLFFGAAERKIRLKTSSNTLMEVVDRYRFDFPKTEFDSFIKSLKAMISQRVIYHQLSQQHDISCLKSEFDDQNK